jgi:hypothetical protein
MLDILKPDAKMLVGVLIGLFVVPRVLKMAKRG